jgi:hypothetical protein
MRPQAEPSDEQVAGWLRDYAERGDPADRERIIMAHTSQQIGGAIGGALATTIATTFTNHYLHSHPTASSGRWTTWCSTSRDASSQLGGGVDHPGAADVKPAIELSRTS